MKAKSHQLHSRLSATGAHAALYLLVALAVLVPAVARGQRAWTTGASVLSPPFARLVPAGGLSVELDLITNLGASVVDITNAGDGSGRLFIVEQDGIIRIFKSGRLRSTPFLDIESRVLCCGERGLFSVAFHPDYDINGFFYVNYTDNSGDSVISRFRVSPNNDNRALPNSEVILKTIDQPFSNHNGADMAFGPDGYLYTGIGDGGSGGDPGNRAQNLMVLLGKMLRLDVDSPPDYIPADNPFVGDPDALDEIWAYGLRNPWRHAFDRDTGDLLIGDVGQGAVEEIDLQDASSSGGENWGWKVLEGSSCFSDEPPGACDDFLNGGSELPILEYGHTGGNCSVTGGFRYRGSAFSDLDGIYFYGDYCSGRLWGATEQAPGVWSTQELLNTTINIVSFGEDEQGEVYVGGQAGTIHQIVSTTTGGIPCQDIDRFQARCVPAGGGAKIQARVILTDSSHSGETVTIGIDGSPNVRTINGDRASIQQLGAASGQHTISLDDPPSCRANVIVNCP